MSNVLLKAKDIAVVEQDKVIIHDINLTLRAGEITTLIGPNGAGKSTLVKTLLGLQAVTQGSITARKDLVIGYMPQKLHIEPTLPLTVTRFLQLAGKRGTCLDHTFAALAERCNIKDLLHTPMQSLSGGEWQRVLLVRALLTQPQLLILDEPVQGVDVTGQVHMYGLIDQIRHEFGCSILMVSHDLHMVASATDQVICLNRHVCCYGSPDSVSQEPVIVELFGHEGASALALYNHHHNHRHDSHGGVIKDHQTGCTHD